MVMLLVLVVLKVKTMAFHLVLATGVLKFLLTAYSSFYLDGFNRATEIWNRPAAYVPHSQGPSLPWLCLCDGSPICRLTPYYF